jgi:hypothetical protein
MSKVEEMGKIVQEMAMLGERLMQTNEEYVKEMLNDPAYTEKAKKRASLAYFAGVFMGLVKLHAQATFDMADVLEDWMEEDVKILKELKEASK